jgi:hypothetical protein
VRRRMAARAAAAVSATLALGACGVGSGTVRIAEAEARIVAVSEAIVRELGLDVELPLTLAPREQCVLRTGDAGLRSRIRVRAAHPEVAVALEQAAAVLVAQGLGLIPSGVPGTILGQVDGSSVTVGTEGRAIELDALTGCRPQ